MPACPRNKWPHPFKTLSHIPFILSSPHTHSKMAAACVEILVQPPRLRKTDSDVYSYLTAITPFEKMMVDSNDDGVSRMFHDELVYGYIQSWADYCEMENPDFFKYNAVTRVHVHVPVPQGLTISEWRKVGGAAEESDSEEAASVSMPESELAPEPEPALFDLDESSVASQKRERDCKAWLAIPRNKRKPYSMGTLQGGNCMNKEDSLVVRGVPADAPATLFGDLREILAEVGSVVDMYKPPKSALYFIGFQNGTGLRGAVEAFPHGLMYKGHLLKFERAMSRSKTSAEMATGVSV
jgi:hypothetical protein